jgi:predicted DNA-binding transcriptional regulator AlpA
VIAAADLDELLQDLPDLLTRKELLPLLRVSFPTLSAWIRRGRFPQPLVLSWGKHGWPKATVRKWLASRQRESRVAHEPVGQPA